MKKIIFLTICLTSIALCVGTDSLPPQPPPSTSTSSTTAPSTTTLSTTTPPTTTPPTTTPPTTTPPTTTPPTTTPPTTTPPTTTPTPPPTTPPTTTLSPSTTPKPTPSPEIGHWSFENKTTNHTCIVIQMAMQIHVTYPMGNSSKSVEINLPINHTFTEGYCHNSSQQITIAWITNNSNMPNNKITFNFMSNKTSNNFKLSSVNVSLQVDAERFPGLVNVSVINVYNNSGIFKTPLQRSYKCDRVENLNMTNEPGNKVTATLAISHLQFEAFHSGSNDVFSTAEDCETTDTPDIVPIAVGCALAGLVIVVLVAYLVGRRRSQARGYLSMLLDNEQDEREEIIPMKEFNCFGR